MSLLERIERVLAAMRSARFPSGECWDVAEDAYRLLEEWKAELEQKGRVPD